MWGTSEFGRARDVAPDPNAAEARAAWFDETRKVRDEALRLLREQFNADLQSAAPILGGRKAEAFVAEVVYASELAAEYLAESERLFCLTRGQRGGQNASERTPAGQR